MRRAVLAATLCVVASVVAPIASASAERSSGRCVFEGTAVFSPTNLSILPQAGLHYEFDGTASCEVLPSREQRTGTVAARGAETLSCAGSLTEEEGSGTLTLGVVKLPFKLKFFAGSPGSTELAATFADGGVAVGAATFATSNSEPAAYCFSNEGAHELRLKAEAVGEL